jgi:hypothetical protein
MRLPALSATAFLAFCACTTAQAGEVYANVGLPGVMLGYAQPLSPDFTLRADAATLGRYSKHTTEEGIDYDAKVKADRFALLADWFAYGGFRLTGGVTFNRMKADLVAQGNGSAVHIGDNNYVLSAADRLDVKIEFPRTTPYLGIGYGHQLGQGIGFTFDLGASIGKAKVTETHSGPVLSNPAAQADIDREMAQLRDGAGKVRFVPQLSIGMAVRF